MQKSPSSCIRRSLPALSRPQGFTLLELLVALAVFAVLSTLAYGVGAMMLGIFLTIVAMIFALKRSRDNARMLFLSSITYLPLLLILMAVTRR